MFFRHKSRDTASIQLEAQIQALADAVAAQSSRLESLQLAVEQQIHERNQSMHQTLAEPDIHTAQVPAKPDNSMQKPDEPDNSAKQKPGQPDSSIKQEPGQPDSSIKQEPGQPDSSIKQEPGQPDSSIKQELSRLDDSISQRFSELEDSAGQKLSQLDNSISQKFSELGNSTEHKLSKLEDSFSHRFSELGDSAGQKLSQLDNSISQKFSELGNSTEHKLSKLEDSFSHRFSELDSPAQTDNGVMHGFAHSLNQALAELDCSLKDSLNSLHADIQKHDMAIEDLLDELEENSSGKAEHAECIRQSEHTESQLLGLFEAYLEQFWSLRHFAASRDDSWAAQINLMEEALEPYRRSCQISVIEDCGAKVSYELHEVIDTAETSDPALDKTIADIYCCGYLYKGTVRKKAKVSAYRLKNDKQKQENL